MEGAIVPSVLEVTNMTHAEEQYGDFVNINSPVLSLSQFKEKRGLPLNEKCADIFYSKTAHLGDNDFIKIDREMLQMIGIKNKLTEKKDSHGNLKLDENGNPIYQAMEYGSSDFMANIIAELKSLRARLKAANIA